MGWRTRERKRGGNREGNREGNRGRLTYAEAGPYAVVEAALDAAGLDAGLGEEVDDLAGELGAAFAWVLGLVVRLGEAVEAGDRRLSGCECGTTGRFYLLIDEIRINGTVHLDHVWFGLPVG